MVNPAALGYGRKEYLILFSDRDFYTAMSFGLLGLVYRYSGDWDVTVASGTGGKYIYLGSAYSLRGKDYSIGTLIRPTGFVSFGAVLRGRGSTVDGTAVGVAVRPLKFLTLFYDTYYTKFSLEGGDKTHLLGYSPSVGVSLNPFPYLGVWVKYSDVFSPQEGRLILGVEVAFSKVKLGGSGDPKGKKGGFALMLSDRPFTPRIGKGTYRVKVRAYTEDGREGFMGGGKRFYDFIKEVQEAAESPNVKTIALDLRGFGLNLAQAEELRNVLLKAKENGKEILSYSDFYGISSYYVASVGKVYMAPEGLVSIGGLSAELTFFKRTFDSLGIKVQELRVGRYKSAVEPLVRDTMSEFNREQLRRMLDVIWNIWVEDVAKSRGISPDSLNALIERYLGGFNPEEAKGVGLVDSLIYNDQWEDILKGRGKVVRLAKVQEREWVKDKPKIAVVVAEGGIVVGESSYNPLPLFGGKTIGDKTLVKVLSELRKDKSVKAVVLRVNSPGGSALASDNIAREVKLLAEEKVIVVSMGRVAGSGGYYISALADTILADRMTLTGSIGVIGTKFVLRDFYRNKLNLNRDVVKTYTFSDMWSLWRELDSLEYKRTLGFLDYIYGRFVKVVSDGRGLPEDSVRAIGEGRIWSGYDAKRIGLVDGWGGVLDAIDVAAQMANLKDYEVVVYPKPKGTWDRLKGFIRKGANLRFEEPRGLELLYRMEYDVELR